MVANQARDGLAEQGGGPTARGLARLGPEALRRLERLAPREARRLLTFWPFWARPEQLPPGGVWRAWIFLGGRGAGKTRAGAEWVRALAEGGAGRIALLGRSHAAVREVMIDGPSGLLAVAPAGQRPHFEASRRRLVWPSGAVAHAFSAEEPDALRGPEFDAAWCDELCAWSRPEEAWAMLNLALRLGAQPRALVTTTPRPDPLLKALLAGPGAVKTHAPTRANAAFLAPAFLEAVEATWGGTRLGRQELDGEIVEDLEGALWTRALIEAAFDPEPPDLERIVVAVDPPAKDGPRADACGIVAAGAAGSLAGRRAWVLADASVRGKSPRGWAGAVVRAFTAWDADRVIVEANQGGAMARAVLHAEAPSLPVTEVYATRAKRARAEPVAALYEQGRVKHAGRFTALEDEMCSFGAPSFQASPDRLDALVWAVSELMREGAGPRVRGV